VIETFDNDKCLIQERRNLKMIGLADLIEGCMMSKTASARFYRSSKKRVSFRQGVV